MSKLSFILVALSLLSRVSAESPPIKDLPAYDYAIYSVIALGLVIFGGLMSGLNVGMLSIDELELEQRIATGTEAERKQASKILGVIDKHHFLLCSILLGNAFAAETLPLIFGMMFNEIISIVMSVVFVLFVAEIVPQAVMTGPDQLKIAGRLVPFVKVLMFVLSPLSYPLSLLLDKILGKVPHSRFTTEDLKHRINVHRSFADEGGSDVSRASLINSEQIDIITGAIDIQVSKVKDLMTPIADIFSISDFDILDRTLLMKLKKKAFSRVPIYKGTNKAQLFGYIMIKQFIGHRLGEPKAIEDSKVEIMTPIFTTSETSLLKLMSQFRTENCHIAFVLDTASTRSRSVHAISEPHAANDVIGIVTMEDVFELVLKAEIKDEKDREGSFAYRGVSYIHPGDALRLTRKLGAIQVMQSKRGAAVSKRSISVYDPHLANYEL
mmetsp:Transcript_8436/g.16795  ORF Transcript_8436/g.16795 Transcript_8436/m.16795 type:complete len:439 (-) Transcript_8436:1017-2333(-)